MHLSAQTKNPEADDTNKTVVEDIKEYSEKGTFLSKLLRDIIVKDDPPTDKTPDRDKKTINKYQGKVIRKIEIVNLDVFGTSVDHPLDSAKNWFQKTGNALHVDSKNWIIKNQLIFSEGDVLVPYFIIESERILRLNSYIHDVRIIPQSVSENSDSVDVMVYVQDVWSMNGSAALNSGNKRVSFNDINFLGYGGEFKAGLQFNNELINGWDWNGSYVLTNIQRTFISAKLYYLSENYRRQFGFTAGRDFISPDIEWAGGVAQDWQQRRIAYTKDEVRIFQNANFNQQDYWLGYAFDFRPFDPYSDYQNRFNVAARITNTTYSQIPELDSVHLFQNNTFYLGRIGFAYRNYYQDRFVFGLGKTEDIPLIKMIELMMGLEKGANSTRQYYGLKTGYSLFSYDIGYLFGGLQTGIFRSGHKWDTRNSIIDLLYFSNMKTIGSLGWRHYAEIRYSYSYDPRSPDNKLNIDNERGIRGFSGGELNGNKKIVINNEADFFIPLKFLGFKLAVITFADFGLISGNNNTFFKSKLYQGYGLGIRIRNENLIFPPIQLMIGYYPNSFAGGSSFHFFNQKSIFYQFNQFQFSEPDIIREQ